MQTLCARIYLPVFQHQALLQTGNILASARHTLFKRWKINPCRNMAQSEDNNLASIKKAICAEFGISSKQFNGLRFDVEQAVNTWSGTLTYRIQNLIDRISSKQEKILSVENKLHQIGQDLSLLSEYRAYLHNQTQQSLGLPKIHPVKFKVFNLKKSLNAQGYLNFNLLKFKFYKSDITSFKFNPLTGIKNHTQAVLVRDKLVKLQKSFQLSLNQHQLKLRSLQKELNTLKSEKQAGIPKVCFGGQNALRAANQKLSDSKGTNRTLLDLWKLKRTAQISLVGSRDETGGNQSAIYDPDTHTLCLSLPKSLLEYKNSIFSSLMSSRVGGLPHLTLNLGEKAFQRQNGQALLKQAITKTKISHLQNKGKTKEKIVTKWVTNSPLTWKLFYEPEFDRINPKTGEKEFAWGIRVSFNVPEKPLISKFELGCIGIDLNADHIACTRLDRFGNLAEVKTFPFPSSKGLFDLTTQTFEKLSKHQSRALIEQTCIQVCDWAKSHGLPIVIEDLDFAKKKAGLKALDYSISFFTKKGIKKNKFAHLLSSFAYSKFREALLSRASKEGIEVKLVNPAYTSHIARLKYLPIFQKKKYTVHVLASFVIGRRGMYENTCLKDFKSTSFTERFPKHILTKDPARSQRRNVVSRWKMSVVCLKSNPSVCEKNVCFSDLESKVGIEKFPPLESK